MVFSAGGLTAIIPIQRSLCQAWSRVQHSLSCSTCCQEFRLSHFCRVCQYTSRGTGIAQWQSDGLVVERSRVRVRAGAAGEMSSPGSNFLPTHFAVRSISVLPQQHVKVPVILFCQKCRWEVAAKYTHVDTVNWHMADLCPQNVRRAAVLRGTSHVTTNQCCKHFGGYSETRCATLDTHTTNPQWVCPEAQQCYDRRVVL